MNVSKKPQLITNGAFSPASNMATARFLRRAVGARQPQRVAHKSEARQWTVTVHELLRFINYS